jgi:hypothetical protein
MHLKESVAKNLLPWLSVCNAMCNLEYNCLNYLLETAKIFVAVAL